MYSNRYSQKDINILNRAIDKIEEGSNELTAMLVDKMGRTLWLDFLNAHPEDALSIWPVYRGFIEFMNAVKGTVTEQGFSCGKDIQDMELLSKSEFLERYPAELQGDAEKLHSGMKRVIDEDMPEIISWLVRYIDEDPLKMTKKRQRKKEWAKEVITGGALIPPAAFTMLPCLNEVDGGYTQGAQLYTPSCKHPNFWLSIIYEGILTLSYNPEKGGMQVQRCAAPDCRLYFVPAYRSHDHKYHSKSCQKRHYMQIYRQKSS